MVAYGFPRGDLRVDLAIARRLGATVLEILPDWREYPDPIVLRARVEAAGFAIDSAHGCWGGQAVRAYRVDLGDTDPETRADSLDDTRRALDWLAGAGGRCLVVHPGGLSDAADADRRRGVLVENLRTLAQHAAERSLTLGVENMPPGVHPGSRMADLASIVAEVGRPEVGLTLDTGHANLNTDAAAETRAAGARLRSTHVHDNDGRTDSHLPPGHGTVNWREWRRALDEVGFDGPVMLECIRHLRNDPTDIDMGLLGMLAILTGAEGTGSNGRAN
jgi:sugar phosphate isomerase/epimerase